MANNVQKANKEIDMYQAATRLPSRDFWICSTELWLFQIIHIISAIWKTLTHQDISSYHKIKKWQKKWMQTRKYTIEKSNSQYSGTVQSPLVLPVWPRYRSCSWWWSSESGVGWGCRNYYLECLFASRAKDLQQWGGRSNNSRTPKEESILSNSSMDP